MNPEKMRAAMARPSEYAASAKPAALGSIAESLIIDLDVREDLRKGIEPFSRIMQRRDEIAPGGALRLRAIFEPVPLYAVLGKQGFAHWTERLADDDWCVWFYRDTDNPHGTRDHSETARPDNNAGEPFVLDVRGLEPPEPMLRTLAALEKLPAGEQLLQVNVRVPQMLLPLLAERGFEYVLISEQPQEVRGLIRRTTSSVDKVTNESA